MSSAIQATPLMTRLNLEWSHTLVDREHEFGALGVRVCGELFDEVRAIRGSAQDRALYELLALTRDGDKTAERLLVQVLLPVAQRMAHRVRALSEFDRVDRVGLAIGNAWEMIHLFTEKKMHLREKVFSNLTMGLVGLLAPAKTKNDELIGDRTSPVSDEVLEAVTGVWQEPAPALEVLALRLFAWARRAGVLTGDEIALLARVAIEEERQTDIAVELGVTVDCVNARVARARRKLKAAFVATG